jgi:uncharacterized membrane protein
MNWFAITIFAYSLLGLEIILDKFLLSSKRVSHPVIYAFYSATLGLFALAFIPFGFHAIKFSDIILRFLAGAIFIYGMFSLFFALNKSEASRVTPVVGAVVPITIFFLSLIFLEERFSGHEILGIIMLIGGGLWISYDFSHDRKQKLFDGFYWSIFAGILLAVSATVFKGFYRHDNFINVYIWTRIGAFCGVLTFFIVPQWRKMIISSLLKFKKPQKEHKTSGLIYILTRVAGGIGSILKEKATSFALASVTIVNAMVAVEYVFIFIIGVIFSFWMPRVFAEKKDWKSVAQKIVAIVIITLGIVLVSSKK